ncbi:MAG: hypothetical protein KDD03_13330, partial [Gelidibacter sp.]|nr:hypothetical protein [Gelidibacter sp.]
AADYDRVSEANAAALDAGQGLETADCNSVIPLNTVYGHFCNMLSPNGNTTFAINNLNLIGAFTVVRINVSQTDLDNAALTEPNISGATQQGGIPFVADMDLELLVQNRGALGIIYSYLPVSVSSFIDENQNIPPNPRGKVYGWYPNIDFVNQFVGNNGWTSGGTGSQLAPNYASISNYETWHRRQNTGTEIYLYEDTVSIGTIGRGFYFLCQFSMHTVSSDNNIQFFGLYGLGSVIGNNNPSGLTNIIGLALDDTDTNYQFIHNDASGNAIKIDLGSSFDRDQGGDPYALQLEMYCASGSSVLKYRIIDLDNVDSNTGWNSITTNLPASTVGLYPQLYANIGTGASANNVFQLGLLEIIRYQ